MRLIFMFEFNTHYYIENMMIKVMKFKLLY